MWQWKMSISELRLEVWLSSKGPCVEDLVTSLVLLGIGGSFKRWSQLRGLWIFGGMSLKGTMVFFLFLSLVCHEVSSFTLPCTPNLMCHQTMKQTNHGLKTLKIMSLDEHINLTVSGICHRDRNVINATSSVWMQFFFKRFWYEIG